MEAVIDNLKEALYGESIAKRKYELFAEKAEKEGLKEISHLFRAISYAETIHIKNHLKALSKITNHEIDLNDLVIINEDEFDKLIKSTRENIIQAIAGETFEFKKMYKSFMKLAKKNDFFLAEYSFDLARKAEIVHSKLYIKYLKQHDKKINFLPVEIYVCNNCGNVEIRYIPEKCPNCDHDKKLFKKID